LNSTNKLDADKAIVTDTSVYEHLMEEDATIAMQRDHLKREKEKLNKAMDSINELENSFGGVAGGLGPSLGLDDSAGRPPVSVESVLDEEF
jgi:hypothetical protein